jgi:hypothetical protein
MALPQDAKIKILEKLCEDFVKCAHTHEFKSSFQYNITASKEDCSIKHLARFASLKELNKPLIKQAFDTRRINQEIERNPRRNAQTYVRSEPYIDEEASEKIQIFSKLFKISKIIKEKYETDDEYKDSYVRQLYDLLNEILRVSQKDMDIFKPKLAFLEQLLFNRYRLSMEELKSSSDKKIEKILLSKDESLLGRNQYMKEVSGNTETVSILKDGNGKSTQESIVNALFGAPVRKDGEKTVERIITIKIVENVVE